MPLSIVLAQSFLSSRSKLDALQLETCGKLGPFVSHTSFFSVSLMKTRRENPAL